MAAHPSIAEVRRLAQAHKLQRCIVYFTRADGQIGYTSYGQTRALCESTRRVADRLWQPYTEAVMAETEDWLSKSY